MSEASYLVGRLLLAMPGMGDPRFHQAVIAMCLHDAQGALGIGIGHTRNDIGFHGLLEHLGIDRGKAPDCAVHHGGPVEPGRGFILHSQDWDSEETIKVGALCSFSASVQILEAITAGHGARQGAPAPASTRPRPRPPPPGAALPFCFSTGGPQQLPH